MSETPQAPIVIYVHGAGNKPPAAELKRAWDDDLFGRDMGDQTRTAYYADLLHAQPAPISADDCDPEEALAAMMGSPTVLGGVVSPERLRTLGDQARAEDAAMVAGLSPQGQQLSLRLSMTIATRAAAQRSVDIRVTPLPEPPPLPLPEPLDSLLLRELLRVLFPDAEGYFFGPQREPIRDRLRQALDATTAPVIVIGHSLGTVIAYDVLSEPPFANRSIVLLVSLGSPLGYAEIQEVVAQPLRVPQPVQRWMNFADPLDLVALDTTLADEFPGTPGVVDTQVDNQAPNNHAVCGYLRIGEVRAAVTALVPGPT